MTKDNNNNDHQGSNDVLDTKHVVLLHTLPSGSIGIRAEEAVYRQYNSCVDFTFKTDQQYQNARRLKRLNLIFERAADRNFVGLREDKLLMILPPGAATKYGLDQDAIQRRAQETKEFNLRKVAEYGPSSDDELVEKKKRKKKRRKQKKLTNDPSKGGIRVLSRGTFLAMFANESSNFINLMAQNEKAHRLSKKKEKKNASRKSLRHAESSPKPTFKNDPSKYSNSQFIAALHSDTIHESNSSSGIKQPNTTTTDTRKKVDNAQSSQKPRRKTHRRRRSIHSINSQDSELQFDVPSDIASSIFDWGTSSNEHPNYVSDISDSETSMSKRNHNSMKHLGTYSDKYRFEGNSFAENVDSNHYSQSYYSEHPADEAGGHATVVTQSSGETFVKKRFYDKSQDTNWSLNEKKMRRKERRRLKRQQKLQEYQEEIMAAQRRRQYLEEQKMLNEYVASKQQLKNENECVFLTQIVNVLKNILLPKKHQIYVAPVPYTAVTQPGVPYDPRYEQMHVMGYDMYNAYPHNSQRY